MELNINLFKSKKDRKFSLIFKGLIGVIMLAIAIARKITIKTLDTFDVFIVVFFFGYGLINIIEAVVDNVGKAYIVVNSDQIKIKANINKKEQAVEWREVDKLSFGLNKLNVLFKNKLKETIDLSFINYSDKQEFKDFILKMSEEKQIEVDIK